MDVRLDEVGRFAFGIGKKQLADLPRVKRIAKYVVDRHNDDGGYAFVQGTDSNAQDTYFGLAILNLEFPFPNVDRTVKWLHDFVPDQ